MSTTRADSPDWRGRTCGDFAIEHVNQCEGRDIWAELGGRPTDWREAAALYRRHNIRNLADLVDIVLEAVPIHRARRGDIVMINGGLAICRGDVCEGMDGAAKITEATRAWKVRHG